MKTIESLGRKVELKATDFVLEKLSSKLGIMAFTKYAQRTYSKGTPDEYTAFIVTVTSVELGGSVDVRIPYSTDNKVALEKMNVFDAVDFENCLVSHRATASGDFAMVVQTYFANRFIPLNKSVIQLLGQQQAPQK